MNNPTILSISFLAVVAVAVVAASSSASNIDHCDPSLLPDPLTLDPTHLTVLLSGFSPSRIPLLRSLALSFSSHPSVSSVLVLWFNPSFPPPSFSPNNNSIIAVIPHSSSHNSLNSRFLPRPLILTRSVLISDDDLLLPPPSLSLAFRLSLSHPLSLLGFFPRSHHFHLPSKSWIYTLHPHRYSILLTKLMILNTHYLFQYTCLPALRPARELVDRERNCEDILMNFLVAMETGKGPVLVEGKGVRDFGDPRNTRVRNNTTTRSHALSARGDHRKKRGECITEFHRLLGTMPLRYSYGKVVEGVGEQGLCEKEGKLVFCDQQ